jgi:hypothetical protein
MTILSLRPRAFRTRNTTRDAETDEARISTVRNAISMALGDARHERDGLGQRLELYYAKAAVVLDSSGEYGERDYADESTIGTAEQNAARARQRLAQLDTQILRLAELLDQLDRNLATPQPLAIEREGVA